MHNTIMRRLNGLSLLMLSPGTPAIIAIGKGITAKLAVDVVAERVATPVTKLVSGFAPPSSRHPRGRSR
jgi:hypothetical protein